MNLKVYTFSLLIVFLFSCKIGEKNVTNKKIKLTEITQTFNQTINHEPSVKIVDIDCKNIAEILDEIYELDQNMRLNGKYNPQIDEENLSKVISVIKKCGMPTTKEVTKKQMLTIWLVFQHADNESRKEYFPLLKKAERNGDLKKSHIALMKDRILMLDGEPQIYGSQITENRETKKWEIYELENPEFVDKRRAEVGLGSLKEYVKEWNLEFNVEQKN